MVQDQGLCCRQPEGQPPGRQIMSKISSSCLCFKASYSLSQGQEIRPWLNELWRINKIGAKGLAHFLMARCLFLFGARLHSTVQGRGDRRLLCDPGLHYCPFHAVLSPGFLVNVINSRKVSAASSPHPQRPTKLSFFLLTEVPSSQ